MDAMASDFQIRSHSLVNNFIVFLTTSAFTALGWYISILFDKSQLGIFMATGFIFGFLLGAFIVMLFRK